MRRRDPGWTKEILENFARFGGELGKVRDMPSTPQTYAVRQWEINEWIETSDQPLRAWVALDDIDLLEGEPNKRLRERFVGHTIKTSPMIGLTMADADLAVQLMHAQGCCLEGNQ